MVTGTTLSPKYHHIKDTLINRIKQGEFLPGTQIPTEEDLIKEFNVSKTTVRKAISDLVYAGRLSREQGRGTFVIDSRIERSESARKRKDIGIVFMDIYNPHHPYLAKILRGATLECNNLKNNLQILATPAGDLNHKDSSFLMHTIVERHIDGLVLASRMSLEDILILKKEHIPFVYVGNDVPDPDVHCIFTDPFISTYLETEHLIKLGHKRISIITSPLNAGSGLSILSTFRFVQENHNLQINEEFIKQGELGRETGKRIMNELLSLSERPTALIAGDDLTAIGAIEAIWNADLRVPEDIAVIGGGNMESPVGISLTTVDHSLEEAGKLAVQMLGKLLNKEYIGPSKVIMKPELIIRESTERKN